MKYVTAFYWQQEGRDVQVHKQEARGCAGAGPGADGPGNRNSLVLVQYSWKGIPLCFACLGGTGTKRAGAYLTGRLLQWQRSLPWRKIACQPERWLAKLETGLVSLMDDIDRELSGSGIGGTWEGDADVAGFLGVGEQVLLFSRGLQEIHLLNMGFGRGCVRKISLDCSRAYPEAPEYLEECTEEIMCQGKPQTDGDAQDRREFHLQRGILEQNAGLLLATASFGRTLAGENGGGCLSVGEVWTQEQAKRRLEELGSCGAARGETDMGAVLLYLRQGNGEPGVFTGPGGRKKQREGKREEKREEKRTGKRAEKREGKGETGEKNPQRRLAEVGRSYPQIRAQGGEPRSEADWREDSEFLGRRGYKIRRDLGEGAFSRVYLTSRMDTGETVACKVSSRLDMSEREGALLAEVSHPLFPAYREWWQDGERSCLAMEYVPGSSLESLLRRRGRLSAMQAGRIALEVAEGLCYLHVMDKPVLFRDVKPANIMVRQDGRIKLLDLGCACPLEEEHYSRAGTPGFGAPEQMETAGRLTPASDVYGLGQTLWAMLEGYTGSAGGGGKKGQCDRNLRKVAEICTRERPEERFPDMQSLIKALAQCLVTGKGSRRPESGSNSYEKRVFSRGRLLCEKNIWKSTCKNY